MAVWFNTSNFPKTEVGSEKLRTPVQTLENLEMKKTLVAIAALASVSAFAQSSVVLSGQVEYGLSRSAAHANSVGGPKGDRNYIQFAATEDLGNGMKAGALLQNRFAPESGAQTASYSLSTTGTTDSMLWEQSMVYISDAKLGEVKMGRFSNQLVGVNGIGHFMEDWAAGTHSSTAYGRVSGQVQYTSPTFAGAQVFAITAKGDNNKYWINNSNGYLGLNTSATTTANTVATQMSDLSVYGFNYNNGPLAVQVASYSGFNNEKGQFLNVGYDFGVAKLGVNQYKQKDNLAYMNAHTSTEIGVSVPLGKWTVSLSNLRNDKDVASTALGTSTANTKRGVTGSRVKYDFSKRTFAELFVSNTKQAYRSDISATGVAAGTAAATSNGTATYIGLAHSF